MQSRNPLRTFIRLSCFQRQQESGEALIDNVRAIVSDHDIDDTAVLAAALHPSQDDTPATKVPVA